MKTKLYAWTTCLLIHFSVFSQSISGETAAWRETNDTLYGITAAQLRETCRIFAEHSFLKSENGLLNNQISLLNRSSTAKNYIIQSQNEQISTLNAIIDKKDDIAGNNDMMIENLKAQVAAGRKNHIKYMLYGCGVGVAVVGVVALIFR